MSETKPPPPPPPPNKKSSPTTTVPKKQSNTLADLKNQYGDGPAAMAALNQALISTDETTDFDDLEVLLSRAEGIGLLETATSNQLLSDFYNSDKIKKRLGVDLVELQQRMFLAGLYGSADMKDINLGTPDALSARAFASLLDMAGRMNQAGSKMTLNEVLGSSMNAGIKSGRSLSGKTKTRPSVDLPGPEEIAQAVKSTMSDLLGREPDAAELESLASVLTTFSKESATERQSLAVAPDGTQQVVSDPAARFKEYLSANYRPEVARRRDVGELASGRDNLLKAVLGMDQMMGA